MWDWRNIHNPLGSSKNRTGSSNPILDLLHGHLSKEEISDLKLLSLIQQQAKRKLPGRYFQGDHGIPIGVDQASGRTICLPLGLLKRHAAIMGRTRSGKSTLLLLIILYLFSTNAGSLIVIDRGDLVSNLLEYINDRPENVILIKVSDTAHPASINLLQLGHYQPEVVTAETIRLLNLHSSEALKDRMIVILRYALRALLCVPGSTLADIEDFFFNETYREKVLTRVKDRKLHSFWKDRYPKDQKLYRSSTEGIINRLDGLIGEASARNLLCQRETRIPIYELVNGTSNYMLLLDLNAEGRVSHFVGETIARVLLSMVHGLAFSRPLNFIRSTYIFCDEVQNYLEPSTLSSILARGGKYHTHLICAYQYLSQISGFWQALEGNCSSLISFCLGSDDAVKVVRSFPGVEADEIAELPRYQIIGRVNDIQGTFSFKANTFPPPSRKGNFAAKIIKNSREKYARPKAEVEASFQRDLGEVSSEIVEDSNDPEGFVESFDDII